MAEPTSTAAAAAAIITTGAAVPILTAFGIPLGLRADILLAGFSGAVTAIALLNSVPIAGGDWKTIVRGSLRRVGVALGSSLCAGYMAPATSFFSLPDGLVLFASFVIGAGAQTILPRVIDRFAQAKSEVAEVKKGAE